MIIESRGIGCLVLDPQIFILPVGIEDQNFPLSFVEPVFTF